MKSGLDLLSRFGARYRRCVQSASLLATATFAGCAVGPNFEPPKPPQVSGYSQQSQAEHTASTDLHGGAAQHFVKGLDIPGQWWRLFHSPELNTIIKSALNANPSLQVAQATLRQAKEQLYAGEGALFPTVNATASIAREKVSGAPLGSASAVPIFTLNTASLSVSYLFDVWGGTRRQIESLAAQAEFERFELEASYITLTSNVVAAAVQEASLRGQIAATEEVIRIERQELAALQRDFAIGATANTAVLAQTASLAQAQAQLPLLQKQLALIRHQLTAFLGRFPSEPVAETFNLDSLRLPETLPISLPSALVEQRPDIRASEALLNEASAQIGVATANMLPQITLSASYGSQSTRALFAPGSSIWNVGAGLAQPLFEGGRLLHERRAAIAAYDAAAAQYRDTVITAFQNVADVLRALESDADALAAQTTAERAAADSLAASRRQFRIGAISYLSLLTAEQAYQQARVGRVQAEATRFSDTAALFQALGGGWWNRKDIMDDTK